MMYTDEFKAKLERATKGMAPIAKALAIAKASREAFGGEWVIEAKATEIGMSLTIKRLP